MSITCMYVCIHVLIRMQNAYLALMVIGSIWWCDFGDVILSREWNIVGMNAAKQVLQGTQPSLSTFWSQQRIRINSGTMPNEPWLWLKQLMAQLGIPHMHYCTSTAALWKLGCNEYCSKSIFHERVTHRSGFSLYMGKGRGWNFLPPIFEAWESIGKYSYEGSLKNSSKEMDFESKKSKRGTRNVPY